MTSVNPYAPPGAAVADVDDLDQGVQPVKMFSAKGRIGRLRLLAYSTAACFLIWLGIAVFSVVSVAMGAKLYLDIAVWLWIALCIVLAASSTIQRSHDMNWSGWWGLLALIPLFGLVWVFKSGTKGANRFGAPPPPNTLGVKILGLAFPVIAGIGILAAVALPAYQTYVQRAKAAQVGK